jgi:hypothetical protein
LTRDHSIATPGIRSGHGLQLAARSLQTVRGLAHVLHTRRKEEEERERKQQEEEKQTVGTKQTDDKRKGFMVS